jgi:hypothetical protein
VFVFVLAIFSHPGYLKVSSKRPSNSDNTLNAVLKWLMTKRAFLALLAVTSCGLVFSYPLWRYGLPVRGDAIFHSMWYTNFAAQFFAGELYPRWLINMNGGLGSPVFFFYSPLPFYSALLFAPLLPGGNYGLQPLGASATLALVLSGIAAYLWLRNLSPERAAAAGAIFYMIAPYHLNIDVYARVALAELWGFVWIPLVLYFIHGLRKNRPASLIGLSLSYAALLMSHLPSALIFSVIPPAYAFFVSGRDRRRATIVTIVGMLIGAGLVAIYLIPALTTQASISPVDFTADKYFERWIRFSEFQSDALDAQIVRAVMLLVGVAAVAFGLSHRAATSAMKRERVFWLLVALASVLMMLSVSKPVWQLITILQAIQFPWRFNLILCTACSGLVALGFAAFKKPYNIKVVLTGLIGAFLLLGSILSAGYKTWNATEQGSALNEVFSKRFAEQRDATEYRPATAASIQEGDFQPLLARICKSDKRIAQACIVEGTGAVRIERWRPREIALNVASEQDISLNVSQFYYPGWTAYVDERPYPLQPSQPDGLLNLRLPTGPHHVRLNLSRSKPETAGMFVSAVSAFSLLFSAIAQRGLFRAVKRFRS